MKKGLHRIGIVLALSALVLACSGPALQPVLMEPGAVITPRPDASVDLFFDDLSPYGDWVWVSGPGWVWYPYNVEVDWRPYRYGHWAYSDYGWTWASDENWGWAVYHYGRWHYETSYGWVWVPGTEWGPAWVAWHEGNGWTGWAPLPWEVGWHASVGLKWGNINLYASLDPTWWSFSRTSHLASPGLRKHIAPAARNVTLIKMTKNVTHYTIVNNHIVNQSVNIHIVEKARGKPVRRLRVRHVDAVESARGVKHKGSDLVIYRPKLHPGRKPQRRPVPPGQADRQHPRDSRFTSRPRDRDTPSRVTRQPPERNRGNRPSPPPGRTRRTERQVRNLEGRQARERDQLKRIHAKESQKPPPGVSHREVSQRQEAEHHALQNKQERERKLFKERSRRQDAVGRGESGRVGSRSKSEKTESVKSRSKSDKSKSDKSKSGKSKSDKSKSDKSKKGQSAVDSEEHENDD
ncbi:MAG: hypothetical protein O7F16_11165 [Acidobacteria bacterium]|nr:hypothetical protein [Acidobacteriota bacterium]